MKGLVVVDSSCPLPDEFLKQHNVVRVPHIVHMEEGDLIDVELTENDRLAIYQQMKFSQQRNATITLPSSDLVREYLIDRYATKADFMYCLTTTKDLTPIYDNFLNNAKQINAYTQEVRQQANIATPIRMRLQNSGTISAGFAALAAYVIHLVQQGTKVSELFKQVESVAELTQNILTAPDIDYVQHRSNQLNAGSKGPGTIASKIGKLFRVTPIVLTYNDQTHVKVQRNAEKSYKKLFRYVQQRIEEGLVSPYVVVAYAGAIDELNEFGLQELKQAAEAANIHVLTCIASLSDGYTFGEKALSMGFISKNTSFDI